MEKKKRKKGDVKHLKKYTETSYQLPIESNSYYCWGYCFRQFINVLVKWNSATAHDIYCECKFGMDYVVIWYIFCYLELVNISNKWSAISANLLILTDGRDR